jgi:maleate isomerase
LQTPAPAASARPEVRPHGAPAEDAGQEGRDRRIGIIVPFDFALDREYWAFVPPEVSLHITRTPYYDGPVGVELARAVAEPAEAAEATRTLVALEPDVVAYACTSGSFVDGLDGEGRLRQAILGAGAPRAVTTSGALLDALRALGVGRVALGTPYVSSLGRLLADFVAEAGFEPVSLANLELEGGIADVAEDEVERLVEAAMVPEAQALFLSCTNLPTVELLASLEARLGIPVLSANQVTMWAALRAAGVRSTIDDQALFRTGSRAASGTCADVGRG